MHFIYIYIYIYERRKKTKVIFTNSMARELKNLKDFLVAGAQEFQSEEIERTRRLAADKANVLITSEKRKSDLKKTSVKKKIKNDTDTKEKQPRHMKDENTNKEVTLKELLKWGRSKKGMELRMKTFVKLQERNKYYKCYRFDCICYRIGKKRITKCSEVSILSVLYNKYHKTI